MGELSNIEPKEVIDFFSKISEIPRGSKNVKAISDYLVSFAKQRNLDYTQDESLNVIIRKPATKGYEDADTVILQGHIDMVAIGDDDMTTTAIKPYVDGDFIAAKNSTLGADDGIAVAYMLAILDAADIEHPNLECVFTSDEEIGMLGATALDASELKGKILFNLDSEDEGVVTVGCAGCAVVNCSFPFRKETFNAPIVEFKISGITGGHSGIEIHKESANANVVMGRILLTLLQNMEIRILSINGGEKDNAIPTNAEAAVVISQEAEAKDKAFKIINKAFEEIKEEYSVTDSDMKIEVNYIDMSLVDVVSGPSTLTSIVALAEYSNGIVRMDPLMPGMVKTSLNLGVIRTNDNDIALSFLVRSSSETEKYYQIEKIKALTEIFGGSVNVEGDCPGWQVQEKNKACDIFEDCYKEMYGKDPIVESIHAGLECGIFINKIENLEAISFGPQMYDVHTVDERIEIESIKRTWKLLKLMLKRMK